jgi:ubiquinone/menaquinone biosynthesis C-methylase UbiE
MKNNITWEQAVLWLREQPEQQELVRACYYDDPLLDAAVRFESSAEWQALLQILPRKTGHALDLGAGRGISSFALAKAGWTVTALEPDPSSLVGREAIRLLAEEASLPILPLDGYAEKIPGPDSQFDLVYGRQVMHHARNLQTMCNEIARVLKPGGIFIGTREHVISRKEDLSTFLNNHPLHHLYGGEHAYLLKEYLQAMRNSGLHVKKTFGPYDTAMNYFPVTDEQLMYNVFYPVRRVFGEKFSNTLLQSSLAKRLFIHSALKGLASITDQTPGRVFSFLAVKPQ